MSNPTTIAITCLLSSEGGMVASRHDDAGHPIYQVTLDGLGRRRRHNAGQSALGRHPECGSAAAARVCDSYRTPPPIENDSEFGNGLRTAGRKWFPADGRVALLKHRRSGDGVMDALISTRSR